MTRQFAVVWLTPGRTVTSEQFYPEAGRPDRHAFENVLTKYQDVVASEPGVAALVLELRSEQPELDALVKKNGFRGRRGTRHQRVTAFEYINIFLNWNHPAVFVLAETAAGRAWRKGNAPLIREDVGPGA